MLNVCLTFDYELFFGSNFFANEEVLFQPTYDLLDLLQASNVTSTFFVDVCSVFQHDKLGLYEYCHAVKRQLIKMNECGQDIQLHIHPHWLRSFIKNDKWVFDTESYKIHYYGYNDQNELSISKIIRDGKKYLVETIRPYDPEYDCIAYRAGGFCLQPETQVFETLVRNGIKIDSSVAPRLTSIGGVNDYDFSHVPNKLSWWVDHPYDINMPSYKATRDSILEISIATIKSNFLSLLFTPINKLRLPYHEPKGIGMVIHNRARTAKLGMWFRTMVRRAFGYGILSLDTRNCNLLNSNLNQLYKLHNCSQQDDYVSIICHPKLLNEDSLKNLGEFIRLIKTQDDKFRFINMRQICDLIIKGGFNEEDRNTNFS